VRLVLRHQRERPQVDPAEPEQVGAVRHLRGQGAGCGLGGGCRPPEAAEAGRGVPELRLVHVGPLHRSLCKVFLSFLLSSVSSLPVVFLLAGGN